MDRADSRNPGSANRSRPFSFFHPDLATSNQTIAPDGPGVHGAAAGLAPRSR
jgi:hypothetical protein